MAVERPQVAAVLLDDAETLLKAVGAGAMAVRTDAFHLVDIVSRA